MKNKFPKYHEEVDPYDERVDDVGTENRPGVGKIQYIITLLVSLAYLIWSDKLSGLTPEAKMIVVASTVVIGVVGPFIIKIINKSQKQHEKPVPSERRVDKTNRAFDFFRWLWVTLSLIFFFLIWRRAFSVSTPETRDILIAFTVVGAIAALLIFGLKQRKLEQEMLCNSLVEELEEEDERADSPFFKSDKKRFLS
jgi:uncharacterized membrane protein